MHSRGAPARFRFVVGQRPEPAASLGAKASHSISCPQMTALRQSCLSRTFYSRHPPSSSDPILDWNKETQPHASALSQLNHVSLTETAGHDYSPSLRTQPTPPLYENKTEPCPDCWNVCPAERLLHARAYRGDSYHDDFGIHPGHPWQQSHHPHHHGRAPIHSAYYDSAVHNGEHHHGSRRADYHHLLNSLTGCAEVDPRPA